MSISTSLHRAAQLQEKIDELREELAGLLDQARSEINSAPLAEVSRSTDSPAPKRRGRPPGRPNKKSVGRPRKSAALSVAASQAEPKKRGRKPRKIDGRSKEGRALKAAAQGAATGSGSVAKSSPLAGKRRSSSPSGPLAPAVVSVLENGGASMNVRDILSGLLSSGYKFNTADPKKNLAARIYRLKGVKQVGEGLFATA